MFIATWSTDILHSSGAVCDFKHIPLRWSARLIDSPLMLPNQDTTNKTQTLFAPAEQYVYSHLVNRHLRSSGAVCDFKHIPLRWSARLIDSPLMLPNQDTTNKTQTLFAPAEQYVYSHLVNRHLRSSGAVCDFKHIPLRWSARLWVYRFQ